MSSFERLPDDLLQRILQFVSNPHDFCSCERTCRKLHQILAIDETWKFCRKVKFFHDDRLPTYRERACVISCLRQIRKAQKNPDPILAGGLSVSVWKTLVDSVVNHIYFDEHPLAEIFIRGDTLAVLLELVEAALLCGLENAHLIAIEETKVDPLRYPQVQERHLDLASRLQLGEPNYRFHNGRSHFPWVAEFVQQRVPQPDGDKIVRKLAYRSGIVKIASDVYGFVWEEIVNLIFQLLRPACDMQLAAYYPLVHRRRAPCLPLLPETISTVSPRTPTVNRICPDCGQIIVRCTPVPKQIEDAARELSLSPFKVYGDVWLAVTTEEEERAEAMEEYTICEENPSDTNEEEEEHADAMEEDTVGEHHPSDTTEEDLREQYILGDEYPFIHGTDMSDGEASIETWTWSEEQEDSNWRDEDSACSDLDYSEYDEEEPRKDEGSVPVESHGEEPRN